MKSKVCIITGANSEIAVAIANEFLSEYQIILCWHESCERIQHLFALENVDTFQADLKHEKQCKILIDYCLQKFHNVDVIINCIGKNSNVPDAEITEEIWDDVISTNLKPAFFLSKYYWQYISRNKELNTSCCIIHISSTAGIRSLPSSPHYIAAKSGLIALSEYYAKLMAPYVRVNTIAPGFVLTEKHKSNKYKDICNKIPLKRMASLGEIAQTARYLVECQYLTGQTIIVDGGLIT